MTLYACGNCSSPVAEGERECGVCGSPIDWAAAPGAEGRTGAEAAGGFPEVLVGDEVSIWNQPLRNTATSLLPITMLVTVWLAILVPSALFLRHAIDVRSFGSERAAAKAQDRALDQRLREEAAQGDGLVDAPGRALTAFDRRRADQLAERAVLLIILGLLVGLAFAFQLVWFARAYHNIAPTRQRFRAVWASWVWFMPFFGGLLLAFLFWIWDRDFMSSVPLSDSIAGPLILSFPWVSLALVAMLTVVWRGKQIVNDIWATSLGELDLHLFAWWQSLVIGVAGAVGGSRLADSADGHPWHGLGVAAARAGFVLLAVAFVLHVPLIWRMALAQERERDAAVARRGTMRGAAFARAAVVGAKS